jgi:8-oxo-dGTP pyrophosphatase MutT (NUDIX family)
MSIIKHFFENNFNVPTKFRSRVEVYILNHEQKKLVVGRWVDNEFIDVPGGGIDEFKNMLDAVKQETLEELGVEIKNISKLDVQPYKLDWYEKQEEGKELDQFEKEKMKKYRGLITHFYLADFVKFNNKILGRDAGSMMNPEFMKIKDIIQCFLRQQNHTEWIYNKRIEILRNLREKLNWE